MFVNLNDKLKHVGHKPGHSIARVYSEGSEKMTMEKPGNKEELMIRYLLGQLPEGEQVRLEEQFFTDDESYQQLLALEDELRYDYARGELTGIERKLFKGRFLATDEDRKKLAFAGALISQVSATEPAVRREVTVSPSRPFSWWHQFSDLLKLQSPVVRYSFAAAVLIVALGAGWLISERFQTSGPKEMAGREQPQQQSGQRDEKKNDAVDAPSPSEEVVAEQGPMHQSPPKDAEKGQERTLPSVATFLLMPGLRRGAGEAGQLVIDANTDRVRLRLSLRRKNEYPSYRAVLRTLEGVEVWNQSGLSARHAAAGQAVVAQLPTRLLTGGDYELILQGATSGGGYEDVDEYYFRIVKK